MNSRVVIIAALVSACSNSGSNSPPGFTISVDNAQLQRVIGGSQPAEGNVFLEVGITLSNRSQATPVPAAFSHYSLMAGITYPASQVSADLTPVCGDVEVPAGGSFSCRLAFEFTETQKPTEVEYDLTARAPLPGISPLPCIAPGLHCGGDTECCTGSCQLGPNICSLLSGACEQAGGTCHSPLECCSGNCYGSVCTSEICLPSGADCNAGTTNCCSGKCNFPSPSPLGCVSPSSSCATFGDNCATNGDCCSGNCAGGRCSLYGFSCNINGEICFLSSECCSGFCKTGTDLSGLCGRP